jgi:hypothetical protein
VIPQLVNGEWVKGDIAASEIKVGAFQREPTRFRSWITPMASRTPLRFRPIRFWRGARSGGLPHPAVE